MPSDSETSLGRDPAGPGQATAHGGSDLASLSLIAHLRIADANERLAELTTQKEHSNVAVSDERLAAILELQEATLLIQSVSAESIARLDAATQAGHTDQGARGRDVQLEGTVPRSGAVADSEPRLLPVKAIARSQARPSRVSCAVCMAGIAGEVIRAPCGHTWDVPCLSEFFQRATQDESLFPPTCCGRPLPLCLIREYLGVELLSLFLEKEQEHQTLHRVYCAVPSCSVFLGPAADVPVRLFCHRCEARTTCAHCSGRAHSRSIRCASPDDAELVALAERERWRRCQRCGHMVELTLGCNHMTCRCRFEFCYVCGAAWKTCGCPQWHEERLRAAAEDAAQWRPLGDEDVGLVDNFAGEEQHEQDHREPHEGDFRLDGDNGEDDDVAYHRPPPVLDLDRPQPEPEIPRPEPRMDVVNWQVGHTASGFLAIVPVGHDHTEEQWSERLRLQANCRHDGDWVYIRVQDQHPRGPLVHPCWRCGRANVEVGVCPRCLISRCRRCRLNGMF